MIFALAAILALWLCLKFCNCLVCAYGCSLNWKWHHHGAIQTKQQCHHSKFYNRNRMRFLGFQTWNTKTNGHHKKALAFPRKSGIMQSPSSFCMFYLCVCVCVHLQNKPNLKLYKCAFHISEQRNEWICVCGFACFMHMLTCQVQRMNIHLHILPVEQQILKRCWAVHCRHIKEQWALAQTPHADTHNDCNDMVLIVEWLRCAFTLQMWHNAKH